MNTDCITELGEAAGAVGPVRSDALSELTVEVLPAAQADEWLKQSQSLVDTPFENLAHVRAFHPEILCELRHAVVHRGSQLIGVLSYHQKGTRLLVVNRLLRWCDEALEVCARRLLERYPAVRSVEFNDLYNDDRGESRGGSADHRDRRGLDGPASLTWRTIDCTETELPASYDLYLQSFGSATRKNLRYCARRLERDSPETRFALLRGAAITEEKVAAIIGLNHLRMASKGKTSGMDGRYTRQLTALLQADGVACIAAEGTKIVAGTLCTSFGRGWTLHVIAHDPKYNPVRLGLLCLLKTIEEAIGVGARRFNFLWGASDYKLLFGGRPRALLARRYYRTRIDKALALRDLRALGLASLRRRISEWRRRSR